MNAIIRHLKSVGLMTQRFSVVQPHHTAGYRGNIYARNIHTGTSNTNIEPPHIPNKSENSGENKQSQINGKDNIDAKIGVDEEVDDSQIQPEWLAMERRVANHKPKRKGQGPEGRSNVRESAWDAENV